MKKKQKKQKMVPMSLELSIQNRIIRFVIGSLCAAFVTWLFASGTFLNATPSTSSSEFLLASRQMQTRWIVETLLLGVTAAISGMASLYLILTGIFGEKERPGIN